MGKPDRRDILRIGTEPNRSARGCAIGIPLSLCLGFLIIMVVLTLAQHLR